MIFKRNFISISLGAIGVIFIGIAMMFSHNVTDAVIAVYFAIGSTAASIE